MPNSNTIISTLESVCQITGATWAFCIERSELNRTIWHFEAVYKVDKKDQDIIQKYLESRSTDNWLCDVLAGRKTRFRKLPENLNLGVSHLFVFPILNTRKAILVGSEELSKKDKKIWQVLSNSGSFCVKKFVLEPTDSFIFGGQTSVPYDLSRSLARILERIMQYVPCEGAWLAVYGEGDLRIEAHWNFPNALGRKVPLRGDMLLAKFKREEKPILLDRSHFDWERMIEEIMPIEAETWGALPLKIGKRLIGVISLWRNEIFEEDEWNDLQELSSYAAASIEIFVTFSETANHLRRQAMLNDFALIVSSAQNLEQIVRRVFALLARIFGRESSSIFLLSSDKRTLREYRNKERRATPRTEFVENHPIEKFIHEGRNIRIGNLEGLDYPLGNKSALSALLVSLKYRGEVIGILALESEDVSAFSEYDENLLVVISSHLAGLVEYGRLREEAEARARNLGLIHEVIQEVIGLTNVSEVVQITADLLVQHFSYELALVLLVDKEKDINIAGISGKVAPAVKADFEKIEYLSGEGISGHVFTTGESVMVDDVSKNRNYRGISGWDVGSEICVALRDGDRILGIIDIEAGEKNAFTHNDLLALESLAGFLTSAVSSVDRYQMLQKTIHVLQRTQYELQERMDAQRAAENSLIQAAKLAAVGEMAAGVAHELNNPLTTVAGFSELVLADLPSGSSQREDLELVLREAKRARSVVRRLLDFARQSESVRASADLNEVIEDVAALSRHLLETNDIEFVLQLGENLPWLLMDRDQIKQVVLNLLHNALHAMPNGGKLTVTTEIRQENDDTWLTMAIQDSGEGITADDLARIFEPFFTTKSDQGGTGLGLAVSYGIVTDHDGFIDVISAPNEGACFTVWLPVEEKE